MANSDNVSSKWYWMWVSINRDDGWGKGMTCFLFNVIVRTSRPSIAKEKRNSNENDAKNCYAFGNVLTPRENSNFIMVKNFESKHKQKRLQKLWKVAQTLKWTLFAFCIFFSISLTAKKHKNFHGEQRETFSHTASEIRFNSLITKRQTSSDSICDNKVQTNRMENVLTST